MESSTPQLPPELPPPPIPPRRLQWVLTGVVAVVLVGSVGAAASMIGYRALEQEPVATENVAIETPADDQTTAVYTPSPTVADSTAGKHAATLDFFVWEENLRHVGETAVILKTQEEGEWDEEPIAPVIGAGSEVYVANPREVFALDLATGTKKSVYKELASGYFLRLQSFLDHSGFYAIETYSPAADGGYLEQGLISVTNNYPKTAQILYAGKPGIYTGVDAIGQTNDGGTLYHINGGEGCGGWGTIYLRKAGDSTSQDPVVITKTGESCVEEPRFIGFSQASNSLILYTVKSSVMSDPTEEWPSTVDTIIAVNVATKQQSTLFDIDDATEYQDVIFALNKEGDKLAIIRKDKISLIAVPSGDIAQEYDLADPLDLTGLLIFSFEQNKILGHYYRDEKAPLMLNLLPDHVEVRTLKGVAEGLATRFVGVREDGSVLVYQIR